MAALYLPPLRQRPGDIIPLAHHFLGFYGQRLGCPETTLSPAAEQALLGHGWPGNIRELENVLHHALLIARNQTIHPADLNLSPILVRSPSRTEEDAEPGFDALETLLEELCAQGEDNLYERVEKVLLGAAYRHSRRNQLATARLLGISRHVARAKLIQHGLIPLGTGQLDAKQDKPILLATQTAALATRREPVEEPLRDTSLDWWGF